MVAVLSASLYRTLNALSRGPRLGMFQTSPQRLVSWSPSNAQPNPLDLLGWKRKKDKVKAKVVVAAKHAKSAPVAPVRMGNGKRKKDVYGPLNTQVRGGFSYFITFTGDYSRYGYVYLMRYESDAFMRFKEFRVEVENQTSSKIKILRLDRGGEYLIGYALQTTARLLNIAPSKAVAQTPYQTRHDKPASYNYLRVCGSLAYVKKLVRDKLDSRYLSRAMTCFWKELFPLDTRRDELLFEESSEAPQSNAGTSSAHIISTDNVPFLRRSARVPQPPKRYEFLEKWLEAIKSKVDSMSSNQVWTLVDRPMGVKRIWGKLVYKHKIGAYGEVTTFKTKLLAKGYTLVIGEERKVNRSSIALLVLYVDDILLIDNDVKMLGNTKVWLSTQFLMKDLESLEKVQDGTLQTRIPLSNKQYPETDKELKRMLDVPYASALGFVFKLNGGVVAWKSSKQDLTAHFTTEVEYIAASEVAKEAVRMKNYILELGVVPSIAELVVIFCDNNGAITQAKESRSHHRSKHIFRRYHLLREMVGRGDVQMD
ncbi:UNVERIFIED_CONTAM: Retrovirus-related Pol polyprotein from transposon TNT 1-94 [Sesamum calycinum]|uniref:Retrovirus-related Pol polyprotein from transposon TNT 1-94 n=1 Tax=Sesamum calycinum TaxID=2727403 RepID=A0AAW2L817_9LAMI